MSEKKISEENLNLNNEPDIEDSKIKSPEGSDVKSPEDSELKGTSEDVVQDYSADKDEKIAELTKEAEELNQKYLRLAADFQNFKRRSEKEKEDIYAYANEKIVVELLDVIDNFERALEHSQDKEGSFAEGVNMIFKQFRGVLEKNGVEEIAAYGETFDPNYHHAVLTEETEKFESGKVTQVVQKGYMLNNKVIRPAMVKVAE